MEPLSEIRSWSQKMKEAMVAETLKEEEAEVNHSVAVAVAAPAVVEGENQKAGEEVLEYQKKARLEWRRRQSDLILPCQMGHYQLKPTPHLH
jgi:hypothetical protein